VLERQVAHHLADGLVLVVEERVVPGGARGADLADQFAVRVMQFGDPYLLVLD
jgi:hypothetical protein